MKHRVITMILVTILIACSYKHRKVIETYPDGKKKIEFIYENQDDVKGNILINGQKSLYDSLGNIAQTDDYIGGKLNGEEIWYYPNGKRKMLTNLRNDSAYGFEYEFNEKGDTLTGVVHYGQSVGGAFYKKWLTNKITLIGSYGDSNRSFVIWKWLDKNGKEIRSKIDSGISEDNDYNKFVAPE